METPNAEYLGSTEGGTADSLETAIVLESALERLAAKESRFVHEYLVHSHILERNPDASLPSCQRIKCLLQCTLCGPILFLTSLLSDPR